MSSWKPPTIRQSLDPRAGLKDMKSRLTPKMPDVPDAPPPPVIEDTSAAQQDEGDRLRRRRGRAASFLSGNSLGQPATASKMLLGS